MFEVRRDPVMDRRIVLFFRFVFQMLECCWIGSLGRVYVGFGKRL